MGSHPSPAELPSFAGPHQSHQVSHDHSGSSEGSSPRVSSTSSTSARVSKRQTKKKGETRAAPPSAWLKAIYEGRIDEMRENPYTPVTFQAKLTTQGLLKDFMKFKCLDTPPPQTKQAAEAYLAAQTLEFNTDFGHFRRQREVYWKRTESKCTYHAWRSAERGGNLREKRTLLRAEARKRGEKVQIPHPAGEDRFSPREWPM